MGCRKLTYYQSQEQEAVKPLPLKITDTLSQKSALRKKCNEYYPFGLQANSSYSIADVFNNRLFNAGSELNSSTNNYETFYRNYDPALGRFNGIDIKATKYSSTSPYAFANNDPVYYNDPLGDYAIPHMGRFMQALERLGMGAGVSWHSGFSGGRGRGGPTEGASGPYYGGLSNIPEPLFNYDNLILSTWTDSQKADYVEKNGTTLYGADAVGLLVEITGSNINREEEGAPALDEFDGMVVSHPGITIHGNKVNWGAMWGNTQYWINKQNEKLLAAQNGAGWLSFILNFDRVQLIIHGVGNEVVSVLGGVYEKGKKTVTIEAGEIITAFNAIKKNFYKNIINFSNSSQRGKPYSNTTWGQFFEASKSLDESSEQWIQFINDEGDAWIFNTGNVKDSTILQDVTGGIGVNYYLYKNGQRIRKIK